MVKQRPAAALAPLASIYRNLDDIVLASTPLRADADRDGLSRFGDDLWDMNPGVFQARAYCNEYARLQHYRLSSRAAYGQGIYLR
jgi:hypothetical protein